MSKVMFPISKTAFMIFAVVILSGCASTYTRQDQYAETIPLVRDGAYSEAARIIQDAKQSAYKNKDRVLYYLDAGMLFHWAGEYETSNKLLTKAEDAIEELFTKSVSKALTSGVLNDNALDYFGEDYEDIYLNVFKALNYIALGDTESAHVEIRRVQIKLNILEDKYKELIEEYNNSGDAEGQLKYREIQFHNDVLARYLSLLLYRSAGSFDDARIDQEAMHEAWITQRQLYNFPKPELPVYEPEGEDMALVNVLSFLGLGPQKSAATFYVDTGTDTVFINMEGQNENDVIAEVGFSSLEAEDIPPGVHFKIQFPRMTNLGSQADRIIIKLDGKEIAQAALLENMELIARETFRLKRPLTLGRTVLRATVKNVIKEAGKSVMQESLNDQGTGGLILGIIASVAVDIAVDVTENADLRISRFFPAYAQAAEFEVAPGKYQVTVEYWDGSTLMQRMDHGTQEFNVGELNLVESFMLR